ncbi:oligosaccharide flippase family protein [Flavobacterium litorale]|uniref:Polysaccharide biosynthesis C-terminal domain-containing protein n=1 Tax=Flavobacterium litorale TaxID=2856519 RepID=A0ABX8V6N5_9FLAO|nr:polysaccharide biosynthesis C-terminal domain-containing protein [Flavobacterium litorale]QYJ68508.1 polysaccharide biosynthesis C-terminal domain-containing protein [Flavobacterium litorale]
MKNQILHKQALFYTIINYLGTAIGIISALFIYPLDFAFSGTIKFIDTVAQLLYPIMVLGVSQALIKFYPVLDEGRKKQLFNYSILSISVIGLLVLLMLLVFGVFSDYKYINYIYFAFPIAIAIAFIDLFRKQAQNIQKLAVPTLFEKIIPKITLPLVFLLLLNFLILENQAIILYVLCYIGVFILVGVYIFKHFKPNFNFDFEPLFKKISRKEYFNYSLYAFAASLGSLLAFRIDSLFIFNLISEEANGIFANGVTLAATLQIPAVGLIAMYAPVISNYITSNNFSELSLKYKEVARLLFFIGALLYSCILMGLNDLFKLLPTYDALKETIPIINILGLSVVINMATGFNTEIIAYSKYYKFNIVMILTLVVLNVSLNLWFIYYTNLGIAGVAYASLLSMTLFNAAKLYFIYKKFGILPFDTNFLKLALLFLLSGVVLYFLPSTDSNITDLIYKVVLSIAINVIAVYKLKLVHQVNIWVDKVLRFTKLK